MKKNVIVKLVIFAFLMATITICNNNDVATFSNEAVVLGDENNKKFGEFIKSLFNKENKQKEEKVEEKVSEESIPATTVVVVEGPLSSDQYSILKTELLGQINAERSRRGLCTLEYSSYLDEIATQRVPELNQQWSHYRPNGSRGVFMISESFSEYRGENLAYVSYVDGSAADMKETAGIIFQAWMNSTTHRELMLSSHYNRVGFGVCTGKCPTEASEQVWFCVGFFGLTE